MISKSQEEAEISLHLEEGRRVAKYSGSTISNPSAPTITTCFLFWRLAGAPFCAFCQALFASPPRNPLKT